MKIDYEEHANGYEDWKNVKLRSLGLGYVDFEYFNVNFDVYLVFCNG